MSVFQRNRIGKGQLLQQQVLNPFILSRELDKISKNQRTVIKVQRTCNSKIDENKSDMINPAFLSTAYVQMFIATRRIVMISGHCIYILSCPFNCILSLFFFISHFLTACLSPARKCPLRIRAADIFRYNSVIIPSFQLLFHYKKSSRKMGGKWAICWYDSRIRRCGAGGFRFRSMG